MLTTYPVQRPAFDGKLVEISSAGRLMEGLAVVGVCTTGTGKLVVLDDSGRLTLWIAPALLMVKIGPSGFCGMSLLRNSSDEDDTEVSSSFFYFAL